MPQKKPLKPNVYHRVVRPGYSVEKVYFESHPGFFVTGSLYRPVGQKGPFPGILTPHGHWKHGRLEESDRNSFAARCINFARQGYVVFSWDMIGYNDSKKQVSHRFTNTKEDDLWGISVMGLQLWNSIRALDFLASLPDVDSTRIGCTGESGGGTQTFMLTAVDSRVKVSAPVNMISAHFQGGCLCENAPGLRLGTFNVEIGALMAPRPMMMIATLQDWTHDTPKLEYPMIRSIYKLYGAEDKIAYAQFDYPHNYNKSSREAVYPFFAKWLKHDEDKSKYREKPYTPEPPENLLNFYGDKKPPGNLNEKNFTRYLITKAKKDFAENWPDTPDRFNKFRKVYGFALQDILAAKMPEKVIVKNLGAAAGRDYKASRLLIARPGKDDWIPAIFYQPARAGNRAVVLVHPLGKAALANTAKGVPGEMIEGLLEKHLNVLAVDLFKIGEHTLIAGEKGRDESVDHFATYNRTDAQERVQDILTVVGFLKDYDSVSLIGLQDAGACVLLTSDLLEGIDQTIVDADGENWRNEDYLIQSAFVPGLARYGGLKSALLLEKAKKITVFNCALPEWQEEIEQAAKSSSVPGKMKISSKNLTVAERVALF